jgi:hypothetical protein
MELLLQRDSYTTLSTQGKLSKEGVFLAETLELPKKDGLPGSAIPAGRYRITVAFSPHFQRRMPLLVGIPNRSEIEMHWGDYVEDTRGCILMGLTRGANAIYRTRDAFAEVFPLIDAANNAEGCWLTVQDGIFPVMHPDTGDPG